MDSEVYDPFAPAGSDDEHADVLTAPTRPPPLFRRSRSRSPVGRMSDGGVGAGRAGRSGDGQFGRFAAGPSDAEVSPATDGAADAGGPGASSFTASSQVRVRQPGRNVAQLIGVVREVKNPNELRLCTHFLQGDCLWGDQCRFSHSTEALKAGAPATRRMNFANIEAEQSAGHVTRRVKVSRDQLRFFMSESTGSCLSNASGAVLSWDQGASAAHLTGTPSQVETAEKLLKKVVAQCKWGISEAKVAGLLNKEPRSSAKVLLAPMTTAVKQMSVCLTAGRPQLSIGSEAGNDVTMRGPLISRQHAVLEFSPEKGTLYAIDLSTNGTFLNGVQLPAKASGKVALFHGDELLFPEPDKEPADTEFGFMINLELV